MKKKRVYKRKLKNSFMDIVIRGVYKFFESPFKRGAK